MTISKDLFLAILSMDAYNRGYGAGISDAGAGDSDGLGISTDGQTYSIGNAIVRTDAQRELDQGAAEAASFYAIAYKIDDQDGFAGFSDGETIISFRGTDNLTRDAQTGYAMGAGASHTRQGDLAIEFYRSVAEAGQLPLEGSGITTTGHSLGGGLAGYIASLYGLSSSVFANMAFQESSDGAHALAMDAANAPEGLRLLDLIYDLQDPTFANGTPWDIDRSGIKAIYVDGEFLGVNRLGQTVTESVLTTGLSLLELLPDDRHTISLTAILQYAYDLQQAGGATDWQHIEEHLLPDLFNNEIATQIVPAGIIGGDNSHADVMRAAIAYSALDEGERPFGDVAIRAMFDDANELGAAIGTGAAPIALQNAAPGLSEAVVQFAGLTAMRELHMADHEGIEDGILSITTNGQAFDGTIGNGSILTVNFDPALWGTGDSSNPFYDGDILGRDAVFDSFFNATVLEDADELEAFMDRLWGPVDGGGSQADRFNAVNFGLSSGPQNVRLPDMDLVDSAGNPVGEINQAAVFTSGDNQIAGSNVNDFIIGGDGNDTMLGGAGKDMLIGGEGNDRFIALPGMTDAAGGAGGDGDDVYVGGSGRTGNWIDWIRNLIGSEETDTVEYVSGAQAPELFEVDPQNGDITPIERAESRYGVSVEHLSSANVNGTAAVDMIVNDMETGRTSGTDTLVSIERVELSDNADRLKVTDASLDAEIVVDMGTSRRTEAELEDGDTLDEGAFLNNVDVADYSGVDHGLHYFNGRTSEREQGLLSGGLSNTGGIGAEFALIDLKGDVDNLHVEGADKIILTDHDDVLISTEYGSIVELGDGQDKVWLQPGVLVQGFDMDDRLTLFGAVNLNGGWKDKYSEAAYVVGSYGERYGINQQGDLLVINPWMINGDQDNHMYIQGWKGNIKDDFHGVGIGPGGILLAETDTEAYNLYEERPQLENEIHLLDLMFLMLRTLTGSELFGEETADPLVLDLDGDGLELDWRQGSSGSFDVDYDLYAEPTAWAASDDGMLARDINGNGVIDDGAELFGYGNDVHGFDVLASLDGNGDGVVDANDDGLADFNGDGTVDAFDTFASLLVWQDYNGNRVSEAHELKTVGEHGIVSFALPTPGAGAPEYDANGEPIVVDTINGSHLVGTSTFTREDGTTSTVGEVLFNIDDVNTDYDGDPIAISPEAALLPNLKGFGTLTDLHSAISYAEDPQDPLQQQQIVDRADAVTALLAGFDSNDMRDLVDAVRPVMQIWGNAAPRRDEQGDIVTGLRQLDDVQVIRVDGNIVDYVWGGKEYTEEDADGSTITYTTIEYASGARIIYSHDDDAANPSAINGWESLFDALFGDGQPYDVDVPASISDIIGIDGGKITFEQGSYGLTPWPEIDGLTGTVMLFAGPGTNWELDWVPGEELAFFERFSAMDMSVFSEEPAEGSDPIDTLNTVLLRLDEAYKQLAVRIAVQDGPLSPFFTDLAYDSEADKFIGVDPARQLGGVFEELIVAASGKADPIDWLSDWEPFLDYVIGNFSRGEAYLKNTNSFLMQNIVDGYESANVSLDFEAVAVAVGLPDDLIVTGSGTLEGTVDADLFYINGDDVTASGGSGGDAYIIGKTVGNVIIDDTVQLGTTEGNIIRFSHHTVGDIEASRNGNDLILTVTSTGETITVNDQFLGEWPGPGIGNAWDASGIEQIVFADGTVWSDVDLTREAAHADPLGTTVIGTEDTNYIHGGTGNDRLEGGGDYDIYRFDLGDGQDVINDHESNLFRLFADSIYFGDGITLADVSFSRDANSDDYTIHYGDLGDQILVEEAFHKVHTGVFGSYFDHSIEQLVFMDGSSFSEDQIMAWLVDFYSTDGDDVIYGFDNEDRINLGKGDDWAQGDGGNDIYYFGEGYGNDQILDGASNIYAGLTDTVVFRSPFDIDDAEFIRDANSDDVTIRLGDGSTLTLLDQFEAFFPGVESFLYWDRIENFEYVDLAGNNQSFDWEDIQLLLLERGSSDGDDIIYGFNTADTLSGGLGNDFISGGNGSDVYQYNLGDGHDTFHDNTQNFFSGEFDVIEFGAGILPEGVRIVRDPIGTSHDVVLEIVADGGSVRIKNQADHTVINNRPDEFEEVRFADGTIWTAADIRQIYLETAGTEADDEISGFYTSDVLYGGAGDDALAGSDGSDTYRFGYGDGHDSIYEDVRYVTYDDDDRVEFGAGIGVGDVAFEIGPSQEDIIVTLTQTGETLTIYGQNWFASGFTFFDVEQFVFEDGTTLSKSDVNAIIISSQATDGDDTIVGIDDSSDVLEGGLGDDLLNGGTWDDTYVYTLGDGNDVIVDTDYLENSDSLVLHGITPEQVTLSRPAGSPDDLVMTMPDGGSITVTDQFLNRHNGIEKVIFDSGTEWLSAEIFSLANGGTGSATVTHPGTDQDDVLQGTSDPDGFDGDLGDDQLYGKAGSDSYFYTSGDGNDFIDDEDGSTISVDVLHLEDLNPGDVTLSRDGQHLLVTINATGETITVDEQFYSDTANYGIEQIVFADGTIWDRPQLRSEAWFRGTDQVDVLTGTDSDDNFVGGKGDDRLFGNDGSDTYRYASGDGDDFIDDEDGSTTSVDKLVFTDLNPGDVSLLRDGEHLLVTVTATDETITVDEQFWSDFANYGIEEIVFTDGTIWDRAYIETNAAEAAGDNRLVGTAGNDVIYGFDTDDILRGGLGDDDLFGQRGSDTYEYASGDGNDFIDDEDGSTASVDKLVFTDLNPGDVSLSRNGEHLLVTVTATGETITIDEQFYSSSRGYGLEEIVFADDTVWTRADIRDILLTQAATAGNDTIIGFDTDDVLRGGLGDDDLFGEDGSDTYEYASGDGNDFIDDEDGSTTSVDVLRITDLNADDVVLTRDGDHAFVTVIATGETITIDEQFYSSSRGYGLEEITFADGTIWDRAYIETNAIEAILGTSGDDSLVGTAGNDVIRGGDGDDTLYGGLGDDDLLGEGGSYNQVNYDGSASDYVFTLNPNGTTTVVNTTYGTDTLSDIDGIWFLGESAWYGVSSLHTNRGSNTIYGTAGDELITGTNAGDVIFSGDGNDILYGGVGDDTLYGEGGAYNQADYDGSASDYVFTRNADDTVTVTNPTYGEDILSGIDGIWFRGEAAQYALSDLAPHNWVGTPDSVETEAGVAVALNLLANDTIPVGANYAHYIWTQPDNGYVYWNGSGFTYEPDAGFTGTDTLVYGLHDQDNGGQTTTPNGVAVTIEVTAAQGSGNPGQTAYVGTGNSTYFGGTTGDDTIHFTGGSSGNYVEAGDGDDLIVFAGDIADYQIEGQGDHFVITDIATGEGLQFKEVEYITFGDSGDISLADIIANSTYNPGDHWFNPEPIGGLV